MNHLIRRAFAASAALVLCGAASVAAQTQPRELVHAQGVTESVDTPRKVAVLGLAALDTLDALGVDVAAVPAPPAGESTVRWPARLLGKYSGAQYAGIPGGGAQDGGANPRIERLKALQPDLIIVDGRGAGQSGDLKDIAPTIDLSISNTSLVASVAQNVLTIGTIFGRERQASERVHALLGEVRALHEQAAKQGTGLVMFAVGNNVMPQQLDGRFGMIYGLAGIRPVLRPGEGQGLSTGRPPAAAAEADTPEAKAAAEAAQKARKEAEARYLSEVMAREPDWLLVVDRNAAFGPAKAAETMAATPAVANSKAWQQGRVVLLDQDGPWYIMAGGLGLLEDSIRRIKAAFDAGRGQSASE